MKKTPLKYLLLLALTTYLFVGCVKQEKPKLLTETISPPEYGQHTDEIQEFLSATPLGSEIYLEQKESGEWYLKVEKTFTAKKNEEKIEILEPIYGESILI